MYINFFLLGEKFEAVYKAARGIIEQKLFNEEIGIKGKW